MSDKLKEIQRQLIERLQVEAKKNQNQQADTMKCSRSTSTSSIDEINPAIAPTEQSYQNKKDKLHLDMLDFVLNSSKSLKEVITTSEKEKTKWRNLFIWGLLGLFGLSLIFVGIITVLYGSGCISLPFELVIGLFGTLIAQIISLIVLFVKFVNDVQYIKMFKTVTHKLLEYLSKEQLEKEDDSSSDE